MGTGAGDLDDLGARLEGGARQHLPQGGANLGRGRLVDAAASLADEEDDELARLMPVRAGDEGVLRLELVHEALFKKEVEGAVDGDGRHAPLILAGQGLGEVVGAERPVRGIERLKHGAADRRQPLAALAAGGLGCIEGSRRFPQPSGSVGTAAALVVMVVVARFDLVHRVAVCFRRGPPSPASGPALPAREQYSVTCPTRHRSGPGPRRHDRGRGRQAARPYATWLCTASQHR